MPTIKKPNSVVFPQDGENFDQLSEQLNNAAVPAIDWEAGRAFSFQYNPGEIRDLVSHAFKQFSEMNAMAPAIFPGFEKMETELVGMTENLFAARHKPSAILTSGGTESILLAVRAARARFRNSGRTGTPEIIVPVSAHPAFWKAADLMDMKIVSLPLDRYLRADLEVLKAQLNQQTAMMVASAPSYPFGMIDPVAIMAGHAKLWDAWMHVDACIGGFLLPFMPKEIIIPPWDFHIEDVQSISVDFHKYAFGGKTLSALLFRDRADRRESHFIRTDWAGGLFGATSLAGSRNAAPVAAAWTAIKQLGRTGYENLVHSCCQSANTVKSAIKQMEELHLISESDLPVFAFGSNEIDIYQLADEMLERGWFLDKQQLPPALHMNIQPMQSFLVPSFLDDLKAAVKKVKSKGKYHAVEMGMERYLIRHLPTHMAESFFQYESRRKNKGSNKSDAYALRDSLEDRSMLDELLRNYLESRLGFEP